MDNHGFSATEQVYPPQIKDKVIYVVPTTNLGLEI